MEVDEKELDEVAPDPYSLHYREAGDDNDGVDVGGIVADHKKAEDTSDSYKEVDVHQDYKHLMALVHDVSVELVAAFGARLPKHQ